MIPGFRKDTERVAGFDAGVQEFQNALATLFNVHYLLELEANNPNHVRRYLRLADPAMETLLRFAKSPPETAEEPHAVIR